MSFLSLLFVVVSCGILLILSVVELLVIPWPVLVVLLLLGLWFSQKLLARFNPDGLPLEVAVGGTIEQEISATVPRETLRVSPNPSLQRDTPPENASLFYYRGQPYGSPPENGSEPTSPDTLGKKQYRGAAEEAPSMASPSDPSPSNSSPTLSYRGIKLSSP